MEDTTGAPAWLYDGQSALRHAVTVRLAGQALEIVETGEDVDLALLRAVGDVRYPAYRRVDRDGWRLTIDRAFSARLHEHLPVQERHGWLLDRFGVKTVLVVAAALAGMSIFLFGIGTSFLAQLVPMRWEVAAGNVVAGPMAHDDCAAPAGRSALDRMMIGLDARDVRVDVVDLPVVNAIALPGRRVILFRGLLDQAASPDEVAAVLAHEIGHVERRDPLVTLLRGYGISLLLGGMDGGAAMQTLLANRYNRSAERGADTAAIARLLRAGISPRAGADFFDRLSRTEPEGGGALLQFLSTHPLSAERRQQFMVAAQGVKGRPALAADQWRALQAVCRR